MRLKRVGIILALLLGFLGLIVSRPELLNWLNSQNANVDFVLWYVLLFAYIQFASLILFHRFDLATLRGGVGVLILIFAWGIVSYWPASGYSLAAVGANFNGTPSFLVASEDQLTYAGWQTLLPWLANFWLGVLTYILTPILLGLAAVAIIGPRRALRAFSDLLGLAMA